MSVNVGAEKRAYKKFRQAGMTPAGACGLIGNLEAESDGFYTNRVEYLCIKRLKENGKATRMIAATSFVCPEVIG